MRKLIYIFLILNVFIIPAFCVQTSGSITVTVLVQGTFNLMVNTDSFDFVRLVPGQTGNMSRADGVMVTGTSGSGNPWFLVVSANPLISGTNTIPNENFSWSGTSEGQGEWRGSQEKTFADSNRTAYISTADEADSASKVINKFKFRLRVPEDTKPGVYTTTVMFTMTE
jgi:hypothetical protein